MISSREISFSESLDPFPAIVGKLHTVMTFPGSQEIRRWGCLMSIKCYVRIFDCMKTKAFYNRVMKELSLFVAFVAAGWLIDVSA